MDNNFQVTVVFTRSDIEYALRLSGYDEKEAEDLVNTLTNKDIWEITTMIRRAFYYEGAFWDNLAMATKELVAERK